MECQIDSSVYLYGIVGSLLFSYFTYDATIRILNNVSLDRIKHLESALYSAQKKNDSMNANTSEDVTSSDKEHTE